jgi:hypothetical protein
MRSVAALRTTESLLEDRDRACPAGRRAADLVREAGDGEAVAGQRLEIVQRMPFSSRKMVAS